MAKCDICNQPCDATYMQSLRDIYRTPAIRDVCPTCGVWADKQLDEIRAENAQELRRRLAARAQQVTPRRRFLGMFRLSES